MFCTNCGTKNSESADFCKKCGVKLLTGLADKEFASFKMRIGAYIIDLLGLLGGAFGIGVILGALFGEDLVNSLTSELFWNYSSYVLYNTLCLTIWSTTIGKYVYGLKVVSEDDHNSIDFSSALKRSLLQPLSALFFWASYWNMNRNSKRQAWHDKQSKSVVIISDKKTDFVIPIIATILALMLYFLISMYLTQS